MKSKNIKVTYQVPEILRDEFNKKAELNGKTASEIIRQFMQGYIDGKIKIVEEIGFMVGGKG